MLLNQFQWGWPVYGCQKAWKGSMVTECQAVFWEREESRYMCLKRSCVVERTATATGVSIRSVHTIYNELLSQDGKLLTPVKRYTASRMRINPDQFDREVIRLVVHAFYAWKEYPTLSKVLEKVKEECSFPGGRFCLWRVLLGMRLITRKRMAEIYTREVAYLSRDICTYRLYLNTDERTKHYLHGWNIGECTS